MLSYTDVTSADPESGNFTQSPAVMSATGASFFTFAWLASGRSAENLAAQPGFPVNESIRQRTSIFARGLKERVILSTNSPLCWEWRRVVFQIKGATFQDNADPTSSSFFRITSNGMVRLVKLIPDDTIFQDLFDGARDQDWLNPLNAKLNTRRIDVRYDKRMSIKSNNDSGVIKHFNFWHGINKNIVYDDEQDGGDMFTSGLSTRGKPGSGDLYVVDFFAPNAPLTSSDLLSYLPQATFYWHEK